MTKRILSVLLALMMALLLPLSALAEPLPWLEPWIKQSFVNQETPYLNASLSFDIDTEELVSLYNRYMEIYMSRFMASVRDAVVSEAEDGEELDLDDVLENTYIDSTTPYIVNMMKAVAALLNAITLQMTEWDANVFYNLLLEGESILSWGQWTHPTEGMVMTSNLFPSVAVPYTANYEADPSQQVYMEAVLNHAAEIQAGIPAMLEYNILETGLQGTQRDLELLLGSGEADEPLVYDGDIKEFAAQYDALGLPYAPGYSIFQAEYNHTIDQAFSEYFRENYLDALPDGQVMLRLEADGDDALWVLTQEKEIETVIWQETETGSMLARYENRTVTDSLSLRFLPTQLEFSLRYWSGQFYCIGLDVLVDASAENEINADVHFSETYHYANDPDPDGETIIDRPFSVCLTRGEEGQRLSIQTDIALSDYETHNALESIPLEIVAEIPNDGSVLPITLYYEDAEGVSHTVGTMTFTFNYTDKRPATPDFDALTMLNGPQDTRLKDELKSVGIPYLNLTIMTKLPKDALPLMTTLLGIVASLSSQLSN